MKAVSRLMTIASCLAAVMLIELALAPVAGAQECSERTIRGIYVFALPGNVDLIGPIAASGTTTFDGEGGVNITGFINTRNGDPVIEASIDGTYEVDPETCTGTADVEIPAPGIFDRFTELHFEGVIVDQGEEIRYLITTPGIVFTGTSVRQRPRQ
jgi:hypothetical protein